MACIVNVVKYKIIPFVHVCLVIWVHHPIAIQNAWLMRSVRLIELVSTKNVSIRVLVFVGCMLCVVPSITIQFVHVCPATLAIHSIDVYYQFLNLVSRTLAHRCQSAYCLAFVGSIISIFAYLNNVKVEKIDYLKSIWILIQIQKLTSGKQFAFSPSCSSHSSFVSIVRWIERLLKHFNLHLQFL